MGTLPTGKKYSVLRNTIVKLLRKSKNNYLRKTSTMGKKQFWKIVKSMRKHSPQIPTLTSNDITASSSLDKAKLLNESLAKSFNSLLPPLTEAENEEYSVAQTSAPFDDILCTEEEVYQLLTALDTHTV